jgi:hypothetical protein
MTAIADKLIEMKRRAPRVHHAARRHGRVAARGARAAARKPGADWSLDRLARKLDQAADAAVGQWTRLGPRRPLSGVPPWSQPVLG